LLRERMSSPIQKSQEGWDKIWLSLFVLAFCLWFAFIPWDAARSNFTAVPFWLQVVGALLILANYAGCFWIFNVNSFAAPVVKIQEGQTVIDTGPYALVRHPMYSSSLLLFLGMPLLLGSWLGLWGSLYSASPWLGAPSTRKRHCGANSSIMTPIAAACAIGSFHTSGSRLFLAATPPRSRAGAGAGRCGVRLRRR